LKKLFLLLTAFALVVGLSACGGGDDDPIVCEDGFELVDDECVAIVVDNDAPSISGADDISLFIGNTFDELGGVTAADTEDGNITSDIVVSGNLDLTTAGTYTLTYTVEDSAGGVSTVTRDVTISEAGLISPTGFFNYKFATTELRHTFMAAAEKYLMNNMYGGVPMFASGSFALYSPRLQLPVDEYVAVMGYGTRFATMSDDDSTVLMYDGELGNAGEYTYRTNNSTDPVTFNQWIYDTSTDSTYMGEYYGALYDYVFNADKTGYEVVPVMAGGMPVPVDSHITETGKEVSTVWQISVAAGLEWSYFDNGDAPSYVTDNDITAQDFVDTYKIALDEQWFRAISGGGDFLGKTQAIVGAQDYVDGTGDWADVGLKVVDGKIQYTFVDDQSEWNVKYWLSSFVMAPIHTEMYDELTVDGVTTYGTSPQSIAYHGPYVITAYETAIILTLEKNPNYAAPELDFYTHKTFQIIEDSEIAFQTFEAGKLEAIGLPTAKYEQYKNHPGLKQIPGATTYRIMINGTGTVENLRAIFPDSTWIPEPILANDDFKMAMFFAMDRQYLAEQVLKVRTSNMYLFSDAYLVDAELGVPYRSTDQGATVGEGLSPSTFGYNFDAARALFKLAVAAEIAAGNYEAGTASEWTVIELEFNYFQGSDSQVTMFEYLESAYELAFVDFDNYVKIDLSGHAKDFPDIYYDYMMVGEFDLSIGGISGSTLDAASFLDTYCDDNRGGFTLNWGIDTTSANINVIFNDFEGVRHNEMWSFNAISSVLNGEVYVVDGAEVIVPAPKNIVVTPTTVSFTIDQYANNKYTDITYGIQWYSMDDDKYYDLEGYIDLVPTSADVVVTGLDPFFYGYINDATILYQGDYKVVVSYAYTADITKTGSQVSPWFEMAGLASFTRAYLSHEASVGIVLNQDDATRTVASVKVWEEQLDLTTTEDLTDTIMVEITATVTIVITPAVLDNALTTDIDESVPQTWTISGLEQSGWFVLEVLTSDAFTTYRSFSTYGEADLTLVVDDNGTPDDATDDFTVTDTSFVLDVYLETDAVATIGTVAVWEEQLDLTTTDDLTDTVMVDVTATVTIVDNADGTYDVSGLTEETNYTVVVTMSDAVEFELDVTTDATPVPAT
jgi:ABC-type oligopeptide transport system substrate-binding subunit